MSDYTIKVKIMDMTTSIASMATEMSQAKTAYEASIKVAKRTLDVQEQTGQSVLKLLESGDMNRAKAGAPTGSNVDFLA